MKMAAEDWLDWNDVEGLDEYYDSLIRKSLYEGQDDPNRWKSNEYGYLTPKQIKDDHLINIIHLCERKVVKGYETYPKVYIKLVKEAKKRKLIR